ncbi:MAG: hypothetical protein JWN20_590, partial [Jatrophihabitantaceae bacterium]|nr:hypothetical protein [Jatrophihabitantaceae bacterium]
MIGNTLATVVGVLVTVFTLLRSEE